MTALVALPTHGPPVETGRDPEKQNNCRSLASSVVRTTDWFGMTTAGWAGFSRGAKLKSPRAPRNHANARAGRQGAVPRRADDVKPGANTEGTETQGSQRKRGRRASGPLARVTSQRDSSRDVKKARNRLRHFASRAQNDSSQKTPNSSLWKRKAREVLENWRGQESHVAGDTALMRPRPNQPCNRLYPTPSV